MQKGGQKGKSYDNSLRNELERMIPQWYSLMEDWFDDEKTQSFKEAKKLFSCRFDFTILFPKFDSKFVFINLTQKYRNSKKNSLGTTEIWNFFLISIVKFRWHFYHSLGSFGEIRILIILTQEELLGWKLSIFHNRFSSTTVMKKCALPNCWI